MIFTDEQTMIRDTARAFARDVLAPGASRRDREKTIEPEVIRGLADLGFMGMTVPEAEGGVGADYVSYALALMEIAAGDGAVSTVMSVHNAPFNAILQRYGNLDQKERVLRPAAAGAFIGAFALTEAEAGSDAGSLRSRARRRAVATLSTGRRNSSPRAGLAVGRSSSPAWTVPGRRVASPPS